ncbi:hypothetical protein BC835DRAFT_1424757 [Cytidiella melzeri]|nr:hypothetical protein BC835DRAFT_1424757 [Cytidiella melzeri]
MSANTSAYSLDPAGPSDMLVVSKLDFWSSTHNCTPLHSGPRIYSWHQQRLQYRRQLQEANIERSKLQEVEVQRQEMQGIEESPDTSQDEARLVDMSHDPVPFSELWQLQDQYELFEDDMQDEHAEQDTIGIGILEFSHSSQPSAQDSLFSPWPSKPLANVETLSHASN